MALPALQNGLIRKSRIRFKASRDVPRYLLVLPALALLLVFCYGPMYGIIIAFQDYSPYRGVFGSDFVGFKYFENFLKDENFWRVMGNTLIINFYELIFATPVPIIFSLLLNELRNSKLKKTVQTISYLPHFVSWVVVASIVNTILSPTSGIVNVCLQSIFKMDEPIYFLAKSGYFRTILIVTSIWKGFGMSAVYYLAALAGIDPQLYEAAKIDGAGKWKQMLHITLPGILPIFTLLFILNIGGMISIGFERVFLMYNPLVYEVGDVISTYVYRMGIVNSQFSRTTAIGFSQSVVNFLLVYFANRLSKKFVGFAMW